MSDKPVRILVVDDNPATLYSTSHVLRSKGWIVLEAATGNDAVSLADEDVDAVILDVNLPDIDGFEVCRRIRAVPKLSRLPVIHLSATFVKDIDKVHGLDAGANGYLVHPVEPPVLIATVRAFLRAWQAEQDREQLLMSERAARSDAERANRLKDDFLATLSHELRTPLQSIIGWTQVLKLTKPLNDELTEALDAIERNAYAQTKMIADLLDVSRITSGKLRLDVQPVDPVAVVEAALSAILPAADAKGIRVMKILDSSTGAVEGDPSRLQQIVWNLISNSVKFTPKGGKIQVALRRVDSHIEISVADTGQGIEAELLPRMFDRFHQGDSSTTREQGGLGLGLAIAKQLVELHGGSIRAHSSGTGLGATFTIVLPLALAHRSPAKRPREMDSAELGIPKAHPGVRLNGVRVLLVDDDVDARRMLSRIIACCGAEVEDVDNVASALDAIDRFQPRVLVSDLGMPGHDGFELIRRVRGSGKSFQDLPAIALTGFARPEDRHRSLLAGFQIHLSKPVDPHELTAAIATLVGLTGV